MRNIMKKLGWPASTQSTHARPDRSVYIWLPTPPVRSSLSSHRKITDQLLAIRLPLSQLMWTTLFSMTLLCVVVGGLARLTRGMRRRANHIPVTFPWQKYPSLDGYYNGVRTLVSGSHCTQENGPNNTPPRHQMPLTEVGQLARLPSLDPVVFDPYPQYNSLEYLERHQRVLPCYMDEREKIQALNIYVYPGIPQNMSSPFFGSHETLGMDGNVCFDRFGRFAPYGYGDSLPDNSVGPGTTTEADGSYKVMRHVPAVNYTTIDWGTLQRRCRHKNCLRFDESHAVANNLERTKRHAYLLRVWEGYHFNEQQIYSLRAMVNELSLRSSGEYDVIFLLHVKNEALPVFTNQTVREQVIRDNIPREFCNMTEVWSEALMRLTYPGPWTESFDNPSGDSIHGVYRSAHMALQWFAQMFPNYDYYWNWEMDVRLLGNYYELNERLGNWAREQPRKGLWERNERVYIPRYHGSWQNFSDVVAQEDKAAGRASIWGAVNFEGSQAYNSPFAIQPPTEQDADDHKWGVGEEADLITFNPIFDPSRMKWVFGKDITGYNVNMTVPPRRTAIITVSRLSKRLLDMMHHETCHYSHSAFPEMWPATVALHYGFKAVYVPHPVYFDRDWDVAYMDKAFNHPEKEEESPFGWDEHNFMGSSFYYNSGFSGALWRRWLGQREQGRGGKREENAGSGRMCLRSTLFHPIKHEMGPTDP